MYTRILVAIDDSPTAQKALDEAIRLASALGASLCIAHAADEGPLAQHGMGIGTYIDIEKVKGEIRDDSNQLLDQAVAKAAAAGCQAERLLVESTERRVAEMINDAALQWGADLIVVGTHGRRGFERLLVGSVAENLVRISSTSLVLVRAQ
jgi:nucleotide-binding universal stress UspA family protein